VKKKKTDDERVAEQAAAVAAYQPRIDECKKTLKTGKTPDPGSPFFSRFALECIIACHTRLIRRVADPRMA
jgi:hypothetical protein